MKVFELTNLQVVGFYFIRRKNILTEQVDLFRSPYNTFCNKGKDLIFNLLKMKYNCKGANWLAFGTSQTAPTAADTKLGDEKSRSDISLYTHTEGTYSCIFSAFWDANTPGTSYDIWELGLFGDALATKDSGYILSHVKLGSSVTKTAGIHTLDVDFTLSFA